MKPSLLRLGFVISFAGIFLSRASGAAPKNPPAVQTIDVGSYHLAIAAAKHWEVEPKPGQGYVLFHYSDKPALTEFATIGLFRIVVPEAARSADHAALAAAYVTEDLSGAQQALFKSNADLRRLGKKPKPVNGGELFSFAEPNDAAGRRVSSSKFTRGWVYFPRDFAAHGALYLVLGCQEFPDLQTSPEELARAEEIVAGIREP